MNNILHLRNVVSKTEQQVSKFKNMIWTRQKYCDFFYNKTKKSLGKQKYIWKILYHNITRSLLQ